MGRLQDRGSKPSKVLRERTEQVENPDLKPPLFSFEFLQSPYCVSDCTSEERSSVLSKLRQLSQLTWQQLKQQNRHALGFEIIGRPSFKVAIPQFVTADVNLLAFRAIGMAPMVGYRVGRVFHILWVDRNFTVYKH